MWPMDDSTMKSGPSRPPIVRALAGDSTMTRALPMAAQAMAVQPMAVGHAATGSGATGSDEGGHDDDRLPATGARCQEGGRQSAATGDGGVAEPIGPASTAGGASASMLPVLRLEKAMAASS